MSRHRQHQGLLWESPSVRAFERADRDHDGDVSRREAPEFFRELERGGLTPRRGGEAPQVINTPGGFQLDRIKPLPSFPVQDCPEGNWPLGVISTATCRAIRVISGR